MHEPGDLGTEWKTVVTTGVEVGTWVESVLVLGGCPGQEATNDESLPSLKAP